jgi:hypothetical protein
LEVLTNVASIYQSGASVVYGREKSYDFFFTISPSLREVRVLRSMSGQLAPDGGWPPNFKNGKNGHIAIQYLRMSTKI